MWCKHRVAACLVLLNHPEQIKERPALEQILVNLSLDELKDLVITLSNTLPGLAEALDQSTRGLSDLEPR